jgi:hypothetical protein
LSSKKWNFKSVLVLAVSVICVIGGTVLLTSQSNSFSQTEVSKNLAADPKANGAILGDNVPSVQPVPVEGSADGNKHSLKPTAWRKTLHPTKTKTPSHRPSFKPTFVEPTHHSTFTPSDFPSEAPVISTTEFPSEAPVVVISSSEFPSGAPVVVISSTEFPSEAPVVVISSTEIPSESPV